MLVKALPELFFGIVAAGLVAGVVIGFTGEVGALVAGVVIGLTGVFVFVIGLTGATGALVVLVIGLTGDVFTAPDAGLITGAAGLVTTEGAAGIVAGVLTPPTGVLVTGAKVPPLSTGGRTTEVTA
jgi:hypothetical protein